MFYVWQKKRISLSVCLFACFIFTSRHTENEQFFFFFSHTHTNSWDTFLRQQWFSHENIFFWLHYKLIITKMKEKRKHIPNENEELVVFLYYFGFYLFYLTCGHFWFWLFFFSCVVWRLKFRCKWQFEVILLLLLYVCANGPAYWFRYLPQCGAARLIHFLNQFIWK